MVPAGARQQVRGRHDHVLAQPLELVWPVQAAVEHRLRQRNQAWMRDPGTVVAVIGLALLVGAHPGERGLIGGGDRF